MRTIRIGSGAGYGGDRLEPAVALMEKGAIQYMIFECLAERTIALAQQRKARHPEQGYNEWLSSRMRRVLPLCAEHGIDYQAFSPLAGGWLTGKYRRGEAYPEGSRMTLRPEPYGHLEDERIFDGLDRLRERGDPATLALAWLLSNPAVTGVVVGPRRSEHLEPALAARDLSLSESERAKIASFFPP